MMSRSIHPELQLCRRQRVALFYCFHLHARFHARFIVQARRPSGLIE
jgi:hypothetical protein